MSPDPHNARRCDLRTDLYMLQPERLNQGGQNNPLKVSKIFRRKVRENLNTLIFFIFHNLRGS